MRYRLQSEFAVREELPVSEIRNIEIEILREFVKFCDENNLKYFLVGGTLIGAVRHQGFVPWDDDMDVAMPRKDFERFRELTKSGKLGVYTIQSVLLTPESHVRPFDRICDTRYMAVTKLEQKFIPPWIDVHALDGLPSDERENDKHWTEVGKLKKGSKIARTPINSGKGGRLKKLLRAIKNAKYLLKGPKYYADKLTELALKYDFDESEYIAAFVAGYGRKERMPQAWFMDGEKKMYFEGILCSVPPHYNEILKHMYGNYLQLPGDRSTHVKKLYSVITDEEA